MIDGELMQIHNLGGFANRMGRGQKIPQIHYAVDRIHSLPKTP